MVGLSEVRITVLKRFRPSEVFETSPLKTVKPLETCDLFRDGQEFLVGKDMNMPEGFCSPAWHSIYCSVRILAFGGDIPRFREKGVAINCCMDGLRPVVFKLERI